MKDWHAVALGIFLGTAGVLPLIAMMAHAEAVEEHWRDAIRSYSKSCEQACNPHGFELVYKFTSHNRAESCTCVGHGMPGWKHD